MTLLTNLNTPQQTAITMDVDKHTLVLAGAGSGKTRVLTTRIAWLLQTRLLSPAGILAVTFTNKAAKEMGLRIASLLPINTRGMWIGTFHGLCHRMLRAHYSDAGLIQSFQILDSGDQLSLIKRLCKTYSIDTDKYTPKQIQHFINSSKEEGLRARDVEAYDSFTRRLIEIYELYEEQCQREGAVDFAELLLRSYELLKNNVYVREHYQHRFRHILVDEFQDTNRLQYQWLCLLAKGGASIFAVGDDDQSIYAFRGADLGNMKSFEKDYSQGNVIRLEQNYRSHGHILNAANALIEKNKGRLGKNLWTDQGEGQPIRVYEALSDLSEAEWIVEEIQNYHRAGTELSEMAILYRSNAQSRVLEHALFSAGIAYKVYGGLRFFERQEIKHALAYLRLIENPHDDTSWSRVVNFPTRGIGSRTLESLADSAKQYERSLYGAISFVAGKGGSALLHFAQLLEKMRSESKRLPLHEVVDFVLQESGLITHYEQDKDGQDRLENLRELVNAAKFFAAEWEGGRVDVEGDASMSVLAAFLSHASLEAGDNQAQVGQDAVQLMTVHAAKGLEFDYVFISGLEECLFPHENSLQDPEGLEEERRLMYVAMTRARRYLHISFAQTRMLHGQTRYHNRSRFLDEVPVECLKWLTPHQRSSQLDEGGYWRHEVNAASPKKKTSLTLSPGITVNGNTFKVGQSVEHPRFGEGVILAIKGQADDAQAEIHFSSAGLKTLALGIAKLNLL